MSLPRSLQKALSDRTLTREHHWTFSEIDAQEQSRLDDEMTLMGIEAEAEMAQIEAAKGGSKRTVRSQDVMAAYA